MYAQVELQHESTHMICWIDAKYAKKYQRIRLKDDSELRWWMISTIFQHRESIPDYHEGRKTLASIEYPDE